MGLRPLFSFIIVGKAVKKYFTMKFRMREEGGKMALHGGDIYRNKVEIDFSVNGNPLGVPQSVREALLRAVGQCSAYPDMETAALKEAVARMLAVPKEYLLFGNGASELFMAVVHGIRPKKTVIPAPSFYGYGYAARAAESEIRYCGLNRENGFHVTKDLCDNLTEDVDLLFLANPNNPTGCLLDCETGLHILRHCKEMGIYVVLDECFVDFCAGNPSLLSETENNDRLLVVRSFTKSFSIPGVRLGYLVCKNEPLLARIAGQLPEWNLSCFAQEAGCACAKQKAFMEETERYIARERAFLEEVLKKEGFRVFPSAANFILFDTKETPCGISLYEQLLRQGILIRDCQNFRGLGRGFYRIAVKTREENIKLEQALKQAHDAGLNSDGNSFHCVSVTGSKTERIPMKEIDYVLPEEIEKRSFAIIGEELSQRNICIPEREKSIVMRVIHTSADFDYAETLCFSDGAVQTLEDLLRDGADIVTDTNMALAGINKKVLASFGGQAHCFMADEDVALMAKSKNMTRAAVSMEKAAKLEKPVVFAIGNAPTALIKLYEMTRETDWKPAFVIGVPVGFVNVEAAKELSLNTPIPYIVNRGRKGGSGIAAAICNAVLYRLREKQRRS